MRDTGPVVWPGLVAPHPLRDHGLDGEAVARLHHADRLVLGVVRHVGRAVEQLMDAVAAVGAHHAVSAASRMLLYHVTHVP